MQLTDAHAAAECLAQQIGIEDTPAGYRLKGRCLTYPAIMAAYRSAWGEATPVQNNAQYLVPGTLMTLLEEISSARKALRRQELAARHSLCSDVHEWVDQHWRELGVQIAENGTWSYLHEGRRCDYSMGHFLAYLRSELGAYNHRVPKESGAPRFASEQLAPAIQVRLKALESSRVAALQETLAYRDEGTSVEAFVRGLLETYFIETTPANMSAFLHLVWMIKRKIWGLPIPEPLFFSFHSAKQHMGKTTLIQKLCTGFNWAYSGAGNLTDLLKGTEYKAMIRGRFLVDFQELAISSGFAGQAGVPEQTITKLKAAVTSDVVGGREMYSAIDGVERQSAVFCSSTNKHIWDVISDPSGMRRYWEFDLRPPEEFDPEFYLAANTYFDNIADLYRAIEEHNDVGYIHPSLPVWPDVQAVQNAYSRENAFLMFAHLRGWEFKQHPVLDAEGKPLTTELELRRIMEKFNDYLLEKGDNKWQSKSVTWAINMALDIQPSTKREGGKIKEFYYVKGAA